MSEDDKAWQNWRQVLKVHPVADEFPKATEKALKELRGSIGSDGSGLEMEIVLASIAGSEPMLIDGRTRLDALEANGVRVFDTFGHLAVKHTIEQLVNEADAWKLGKKLNHDRRHLKHEDKVAIAKSIMVKCPTRSSRSIAKEAGISDKTAEKIRQKMVPGAETPHVAPETPAEPGQATAGADIPHLEPKTATDGSPLLQKQETLAPAEKRTGADGKFYTMKPKLKAAAKPQATELPTKAAPTVAETPEAPAPQAVVPVAPTSNVGERIFELERLNLALQSEIDDLKDEVARLQAENADLKALMEIATAPTVVSENAAATAQMN